LQVHLDAVPLVSTDQFARHVEGKPVLVVGLDAIDEFVMGDGKAVLLSGVEEVIHRHPPAWLERQPEFLGGVSQVFRQVLADGDQPFVHDLLR